MHAMTDLDSPNLVVWPKWCYANGPKESEPQGLALNNNSPTTNNNNNNNSFKEKDSALCVTRACKKTRRESPNGTSKEYAPSGGVGPMPTDANGNVKAERLSPDPATEGASTQVSPSPSTPPKSPGSHRTRTPSFAGTPPNPAFTPPTGTLHPPYDRFSPAALGAVGGLPGAPPVSVKQMENLVARNCSDLMRSLAAKYNNSSPNDYFSTPSNGFLRSSLPNISPFKGGGTPFMNVNPPNVSTAGTRESEKKVEPPHVSTVTTSLPQGIPPPGAPPLFPGHGIPGFPGFPLVDMSSTQVLINMVRNASAAQQSQLENYLRGAMKRPADAPTSPLDLSASVAAKRPRTDFGRNFDVKSFFPEGERRLESTKTSSPPIPSPTGPKPPSTPSPGANAPSSGKASAGVPCSDRNCPSLEGVLHWTVEDVCDFVRGIDLCAEYAEAFREHRIDGSSLPLLTEDHLTTSIHMKLGPALKLRSVLARRLGSCGVCLHCAHCHSPPTAVERRPTSASSGQ